MVCESRPHTEPRKHIIHGIEDQDTKSVVFSVLNFCSYCCNANSDNCHCDNSDPLRFLSSFEDMDMTNLKQPLFGEENTFRIVGHCDGIICVQLNAAEVLLWNPAIHEAPKLLPPEPYLDVDIGSSMRDMSRALGFGYDPKTNDYKVVDIGYPGYETYGDGGNDLIIYTPKPVVYSLGTDTWREIATGSLETETTNLWPEDFQFYLKGMCYWVGHEQSKLIDGWGDMLVEDIRDVIISFDMRDEVFHDILLPHVYCLSPTIFYNIRLLLWNHKSVALFGCCGWGRNDESFGIWVLHEEFGNRPNNNYYNATWTKHHAFDLTLTHKPLAFWKSDEILLASISTDRYQSLVSYNLHTKASSQCLPILGVPDGFAAVIYMPSMVSVLGFNKFHNASTKVL
ncbi:F-box/kelch-repeat protein At3g06240-like [Prunus avium]|uniref:F-box/kelch-repeat protein At3g06240-like n=1 Tax=Prunus avium TaxID=42229 RepID=A0A6P5RSP3_PRUAV|nr:F-box/kelch-repeat protein At3g06240-like [Prunus avium]